MFGRFFQKGDAMKMVFWMSFVSFIILSTFGSQNSTQRAESLTSYGNADIVRGGLLNNKWYKVPDVKNNQVP